MEPTRWDLLAHTTIAPDTSIAHNDYIGISRKLNIVLIKVEARVLQHKAVANVTLVQTLKGLVHARLVHSKVLNHWANIATSGELEHAAMQEATRHNATQYTQLVKYKVSIWAVSYTHLTLPTNREV